MKNNEFIAIKEAKIIFTPDGRILFLDKDTEVVNLKECTDCKQKDQRIAELESEVERLKAKLEIWNRFNKEDYIHKGEKATERDYYYYTNGASAVLENEVEQLKANQNKIAIEKLGELENWINQPYTKGDCYYLNRGATIETTDLQQKIKELKGDK